MDDGDSRPIPTPHSGAAAAGAPRLEVDIIDEAGDWTDIAAAEEHVRAAAGVVSESPDLDIPPSTATVALTSDAAVQELNRTYRGKDKATNVLSFPSVAGPGSPAADRVFLGDVVLAAGTVLREAGELGIDPRHHLQHLVVHGLLHLIGYDHETDDTAAEMEALETRLLSRIGVADPYAESIT
jgi:probable rRNA maturation factor